MEVNNNKSIKELYWPKEDPSKKVEPDRGRLKQEDFFKLLTEQLSTQDPTKPVDNDQMVAQMTQFTMAESLTELNTKFDKFATSMTSNQALQASSLVGQPVLIPGDTGYVHKKGVGITGTVIAANNVKSMKITIENNKGEVVRVMNVGNQSKGNIEFGWDGKNNDGQAMPPGNYKVKVTGTVNDKGASIPTAVHRHVKSVSLASSSQGIILNLHGDQSIKLTDALEIGG